MNLKDFWIKIFPHIRNKFILTSAMFFVWIFAFDQYNLIDRFKNQRKLNQLRQEKAHYITEIEENRRKLEELKGNQESLEKFAREQYLMKKTNEEIFVVIKE